MDDFDALRDLAARQDGVLTRNQAMGLGMHRSSIAHRLRPRGPWRRLLPGIYSTVGPPGLAQRLTAALLYVGPTGAFSGPTGLHLHRLPAPPDPRVHVTVPAGLRRSSVGLLVVHHAMLPVRTLRVDARPVCSIERSLADACAGARDRLVVSRLVGVTIRAGAPSLAALRAGAEQVAREGGLLRAVLAELASPDDSPAAEVGALVRLAGLPEPCWDIVLEDGAGRALGAAAAWWPEAAVAVRFGRRDPRDVAARRALARVGIVTLSPSARQLRTLASDLAVLLGQAYETGRARRRPPAAHVRSAGETADGVTPR